MNAKLEKLIKDEAVAWENVESAQKIVNAAIDECNPVHQRREVVESAQKIANAAMAVWSLIFQERRREEMREELRKENEGK